MTGVKAVLFDFDNTLGDRDAYAYACYQHILEENTSFDDPMEEEAVLQEVMLYDQQGDVNKKYVQKKLAEVFDIHLPYEDFNTYWDSVLWQYAVPKEGAEEVLTYLSGRYMVCLVTNGPADGQRKKVEQSGLSKFFPSERIAVSGDYGIKKPDPRFFVKACAKFGVKPEECVYVGDIFYRDVLGAYRAHMKPIWITTKKKVPPHTAEVTIIHELKELEDLL